MRPIVNVSKHIRCGHGQYIKIERGTGRVGFFYRVNREVSCEFDMLSEVGKAYKILFEKTLSDHGIKLKTVDNGSDCFDVVIAASTPD